MAQRNDGVPQHGIPDDGDPLLVRPFLTGEPGTSDAEQSSERWPAGHDAPPMLEAPVEHGPRSPDGPGQGRRRLHVAAGAEPPSPPEPPRTAPPDRISEPATAIGAAVWLGGGVAGPARPGPANVAPVWRAESNAAPAWPADRPAAARERPEATGQPAGTGREVRRRRSYALAGAGAAAILGLAVIGYGMFPTAGEHDTALPSGALPPQVTASGPSAARGATPAAPGRSAAPGAPAAPGTTTGPAAGTTPGTPGAVVAPVPGVVVPLPGGTTPPTDGTAPAPEATPPAPADTIEPAPSVARVGAIASDDNLCLDVNGGVPVDDNHVQVYDCNGTSAQRWTLATDGTLQAVGKCAQVTGDATVHIAGCDDRDEAQWRAGEDDSLVNLATNKCLTDPANGDQSGTGVVVTACTGGDNQQWDLPN